MESRLILRQLRLTGSAVVAFNQVNALREAAELAGAQLPVRWEFEPSTPATVIQRLAGAGQGAVRGGLAGLSFGVLLAAFFPPSVIGVAAASGAVVGAIQGHQQVQQGWRVRLVQSYGGAPLLEVSRTS